MRSGISHDPISADVNLYEYVGDNPLVNTDPTGMCPQQPPGHRNPDGSITPWPEIIPEPGIPGLPQKPLKPGPTKVLYQENGCEHPLAVGCAIDRANKALAKPKCQQWFRDHGADPNDLPKWPVRCHSNWRTNCWLTPHPTWTVPGGAIHVCDWAAEQKSCVDLASLFIHEYAHHFCTWLPFNGREDCANSAMKACDTTDDVPLWPDHPPVDDKGRLISQNCPCGS